ncbi:MAG: DUF2817 domain-containing protein [Phenylobacterium sp.]|uniref:DUF2817 domain-containing protein n=1 Tax=Phenylobacterium sp. TaxID=1871053 RepID=UPI001A6317A8|nr:DUF2817 domain-containing protein [Phenylobacterium sp.]MBL8553991.1 DUF2817 domain-containing protein [Phenylobacterium sp.]
MDAAAFFSDDLATASARFATAAMARGAAVEAIIHPLRGPGGESLQTMVCGFGPPTAETVLVLNSGVHGTEAFVGSGLQVGVLRDADFLAPAPDVRVVAIHAINPYGAAWGRYVNEDNVDLMKNLTYGDFVSPTDPVFLEIDDAIDLPTLRTADAWRSAQARRAAIVAAHGAGPVMAALKRGQTARPASLCFNGVRASWSKRTLDGILRRRLQGARRACFLDLHSGVGEWGEAFVMAAGDPPSCARVRAWLGSLAHDLDLPMEPAAYSTLGRAAPGVAMTAAVLEIGTVAFDDAFRETMAFEMHDHLYGARSAEAARETKRRFRSYYDPAAADWRREGWRNARAMFARFLDGLQAWDEEARER